MSNEKSTIGKT